MSRIYWFAALLAVAFSACSGESSTSRVIDNRSDKELKVLIFRFGYPQGDTLRIAPFSKRTLSTSTGNSSVEEAPPCADRIDSAQVFVTGGGTINRKLSNNSHWSSESEQTSSIPPKYKHTCTFRVNQNNIVP